MKIGSLWTAVVLIFSSVERPPIACSKARDLNSKNSSQTLGAVGVRVLPHINTAEEKYKYCSLANFLV